MADISGDGGAVLPEETAATTYQPLTVVSSGSLKEWKSSSRR